MFVRQHTKRCPICNSALEYGDTYLNYYFSDEAPIPMKYGSYSEKNFKMRNSTVYYSNTIRPRKKRIPKEVVLSDCKLSNEAFTFSGHSVMHLFAKNRKGLDKKYTLVHVRCSNCNFKGKEFANEKDLKIKMFYSRPKSIIGIISNDNNKK